MQTLIDYLFLQKENEVLFFLFSTFEIKEVNKIKLNNEIIYEIKLFCLGKYLKEIEENLNEAKTSHLIVNLKKK